MAAVTIHSDVGAQDNKVCHCFHCFPIYLPWSDGTGYWDVNSELQHVGFSFQQEITLEEQNLKAEFSEHILDFLELDL